MTEHERGWREAVQAAADALNRRAAESAAWSDKQAETWACEDLVRSLAYPAPTTSQERTEDLPLPSLGGEEGT